MTEAKEKKQTAFESGWTVVFDEVRRPGLNCYLFERSLSLTRCAVSPCCSSQKVPQQTNENDCGVFVLEVCATLFACMIVSDLFLLLAHYMILLFYSILDALL